MTDRVKELINDYSTAIDHNLWSILYQVLSTEQDLDYAHIGEFTECIIQAGIEPLDWVDHIPVAYLFQTNIETLDVREGIQEIQSWAFANCKKLNRIVLPHSVKMLAENAFANSENIAELVIMNPDIEIGYFAFYDCTIDTVSFNGTKDQWLVNNYRIDARIVDCIDGRI